MGGAPAGALRLSRYRLKRTESAAAARAPRPSRPRRACSVASRGRYSTTRRNRASTAASWQTARARWCDDPSCVLRARRTRSRKCPQFTGAGAQQKRRRTRRYGPVHPFDRHTPPPHGGVCNRPPTRRNWSFIVRASCVRRGNSCGSCPLGRRHVARRRQRRALRVRRRDRAGVEHDQRRAAERERASAPGSRRTAPRRSSGPGRACSRRSRRSSAPSRRRSPARPGGRRARRGAAPRAAACPAAAGESCTARSRSPRRGPTGSTAASRSARGRAAWCTRRRASSRNGAKSTERCSSVE